MSDPVDNVVLYSRNEEVGDTTRWCLVAHGRMDGRAPWSWANLPGLWHSWDHGDDWASYIATDGRMRVLVSAEQGGRPWLTSERRPEPLQHGRER